MRRCFGPGLSIVKGLLKTIGNVELRGDGVTFVFVGENTATQFSGGTTFNSIARDNGPLAGFLFFFDDSAVMSNTNAFSGNSNTYFKGIMAFGERDVAVSGDSEVSSGFPLSVMAAREITLNGNGTLFFNVDEQNTSLPIPDILYEKNDSDVPVAIKKEYRKLGLRFRPLGADLKRSPNSFRSGKAQAGRFLPRRRCDG